MEAGDGDFFLEVGCARRRFLVGIWRRNYFFLWPDFGAADLAAAIVFFRSRQRRFGRTGDQLEALAD